MARDGLENANPTLHTVLGSRDASDADWDDSITDPFDVREIFDLIRDINDPEHPLTLEQLNVVTEDQITAFQLLEYQMVWWVCRFDTLGKLVLT